MKIVEDSPLIAEIAYRKEIFGNTSKKSFPKTQEKIRKICKEIKELYPKKQIIIIDVGCSYGDNTIGLAKEIAQQIRDVDIIGIDKCITRITKAKLKHFIPKIYLKLFRINVGFYLKGLAGDNYIENLDGTEIKADIMKITDISKFGFESLYLNDWAEHNLKEGGYLFYANSDISGLTSYTTEVSAYRKEKDKLNLLEKYTDEDLNTFASRE